MILHGAGLPTEDASTGAHTPCKESACALQAAVGHAAPKTAGFVVAGRSFYQSVLRALSVGDSVVIEKDDGNA